MTQNAYVGYLGCFLLIVAISPLIHRLTLLSLYKYINYQCKRVQ